MKIYIYINTLKSLFYVFLGAISQPLIAFAYTLINLEKNNLDNTVINIKKLILEITNKMVIHISHKSNLDYIKQYDEVIKLA